MAIISCVECGQVFPIVSCPECREKKQTAVATTEAGGGK
jgi:hypothetical protein